MNKKLICSLISILIASNMMIGCEKDKNVIKQTSPSPKAVAKSSFSNNDLIYFIMTDRFYNGDKSNDKDVDSSNPKAYHGGDIKGIIEKLDYIKSIGTTAIWLTPVVENENGGYHGYWTKDFYKVDPHLGTLEDLQTLVKEAHKRDIKVVLDYVVNHTGYKTNWLSDGKHNDWFHPEMPISDFNDKEQCEKGWLCGLPDLNQENLEVKDYLITNTLWWIENTGIDGMRLDTVKHVSTNFWKDFSRAIKDKYPKFYLLGEVWSDDVSYLQNYISSGIDGVTNYSLFNGMKNAFKTSGSTNSLVTAIENEGKFTNPTLNGIFIDNHDNKRFISDAGENSEAYLRLALAFEMTYPSIPVIYYGTEIAMEGGDDPDNRRDMEWQKIDNSNTLSFCKKLAALRTTVPAFKSSEIKVLDYDSNYLVYLRGKDKNSVVVAMNTENKDCSIKVKVPYASSEYVDLITSKIFKVDNGVIDLNLKGIDFVMLQPK